MLFDIKKINNELMDIRTESYKVILIDTSEGKELANIDARDKKVWIKSNLTDEEKISIMEFLRRWNVIKANDWEVITDKLKKFAAIIMMRGYGKYNINEY